MMQHLQSNTTLQGGKYKIERVLGQGGFGITYLASNTMFDIDVTIKEFFMKDENGRDGCSVTMPYTTKQELFDEQKEKFKKEARRIRQLKNEHIIAVHDLFEENGTAYYVMDFVDGENLAERLKRTGQPMTEEGIRRILPQLLDALKNVHDAGIWHLDLKPANIMMDKSGNVKLIDFGASKQLNVQKGGATTSTAISYTNGYAPREQMEQNYDKFGPWTDFYALGATLYTLLTNKRPPLPTDIDDDISEDKHLALPLPDSVSKEMKGCILWLMQTNRNERPQSVEEIAEWLDKFETKDSHKDLNNDKAKEILSIDEETIVSEADTEETLIGKKEENKQNTSQVSVSYPNKDFKSSKDDSSISKDIFVMIVASVLLLIGIYYFSDYANSNSYHNTTPRDSIESVIDTSAVFSDNNRTSQNTEEDNGSLEKDNVETNSSMKNEEDDSHVIYGEWFQPHNAGHHIIFYTNGDFRYSPDCYDCQEEHGTYVVQGGSVVMNYEDGKKLVLDYGSIDDTSIYYLTKKSKSNHNEYEYYFVKGELVN